MFFMRTMVGDRLNQINMPRLYAYVQPCNALNRRKRPVATILSG